MVAVALSALRPFVLIERELVFAAVKQTGVGRVTETAAPADLRDARRASGVVAVTGVTRRRAEIAAHE